MTDVDREHWLNGWPRIGETSVLMGTGVHCAGCGKFGGVTCVAFDEDYQPPEKAPDWPFNEANCPVCYLINLPDSPEPRKLLEKSLDERLRDFKAAKQRLTDHLTDAQTSPEIRPCPFCRFVPLPLTAITLSLWFWNSGHFVECGQCGAHGPLRFTRARAIDAWNGRAL